MRALTVGLSPCPNDTFIFHALLDGLVSVPGWTLEPVLEDVETLNRLAREARLDVTKISFHAFGYLRSAYELLEAGSALGRGCGPLVVVRPEHAGADVAGLSVAVPGRLTSAALLLRLYAPALDPERLIEMPFDRILDAVARGAAGAGLIIHESRFTFREHGLVELVDLGRWWEEVHGHPIPLGGIIARKDLGRRTIEDVGRALRESVLHARRRPQDSRDFVRSHAQELSAEVIQAHIELYVNDFTVALGREGRAAVDHLFAVAEASGILPRAE